MVAFVGAAIERSYTDGASDIHFETDRQGVSVKYRLDGVMAPGERLADPQRAEEVISRIKVMAQLDITERRRPQDGRIHSHPANAEDAVDLRVSIMPSIFGEDAVLRLLDKAQLRHSQNSVSLDLLRYSTGLKSANGVRSTFRIRPEFSRQGPVTVLDSSVFQRASGMNFPSESDRFFRILRLSVFL